MRDTVKPANGIAQDTIVITHCRNWRQWKSARKCLLSRCTGGNWAEDVAPQGCDQSAVSSAGTGPNRFDGALCRSANGRWRY